MNHLLYTGLINIKVTTIHYYFQTCPVDLEVEYVIQTFILFVNTSFQRKMASKHRSRNEYIIFFGTPVQFSHLVMSDSL